MLENKLAKKLVNYYLNQFEKDTSIHDKIEFELLFTCYSPSSTKRLSKLRRYNFKSHEIKKITESLKAINKKIFKEFDNYKKYIEILKYKQNKVSKSEMYEIDKIYWLCEDCKRYGTYSFAGLARCGFIAIEILNSLVSEKILTTTEKTSFLKIFTQ